MHKMKNVGPRKWDALPQCLHGSANGIDDYLCKLAAFNFSYVERYLYHKTKGSFQLKNKQKYQFASFLANFTEKLNISLNFYIATAEPKYMSIFDNTHTFHTVKTFDYRVKPFSRLITERPTSTTGIKLIVELDSKSSN